MPILVPSDDKHTIEVDIKYIDRDNAGIKVFQNSEEEARWVENQNKHRTDKLMELKAAGEEIPEELKVDAKDEVQELKTWWRRTNWGTQADIINESRLSNEISGEVSVDFTKYRMNQMKHLMAAWSLKDAEGNPVPIHERILSRLDLNVATSLIDRYEDSIAPEEELEKDLKNLE